MRKKGGNSVKCAGKSAITPDDNNDFTAYLHRRFGHRKLDAILNFFHRWGTTALAVSAAVPIPMPTNMLFAAAGASDYGVGRFLMVVIICRGARYTFIAMAALFQGVSRAALHH